MSVDAGVQCNCFELGLMSAPPCDHSIRRDEFDCDSLWCECSSDRSSLEVNIRFDTWVNSCKHRGRGVVRIPIGNVAMVAYLANALKAHDPAFKTIVDLVLYNGTHCGDVVPLTLNDSLQAEVHTLFETFNDDDVLHFGRTIQQLLDTSRAYGRPIHF
jgi:hypothetical protein